MLEEAGLPLLVLIGLELAPVPGDVLAEQDGGELAHDLVLGLEEEAKERRERGGRLVQPLHERAGGVIALRCDPEEVLPLLRGGRHGHVLRALRGHRLQRAGR